MSAGGMPELGSKISLISKADIRYEGRLFTVDPQECTIALANVRSFGTEDRETQYPIAPQSQIYDYILFRGTDIKDIRVVNNGMPHPNDPAIMQMQLPNGQHLMPPFPMPAAMNPPIGNAYPFAGIGNLGGIGNSGGGGGVPSGLAPGSFMMNQKPKQQSELNVDAIPEPSTVNTNAPSTSTIAPQIAAEHKDQASLIDLITGGSRSTTPVSLISRKSPSADMGVQANQHHHNQQQHQQQHHQNSGRDAGHKRQQQQRGGVGGSGMGRNDDYRGNQQHRDRRDSGRMDYHNNQHDNRNQNQRNNHPNNNNNRGWVNRGGNNNNNNNMMRNQRGGRGSIPNRNFFPQSGYRQQTGNMMNKTGRPPKNTIKFEQDYDFEQANNKFEELRSQFTKLKVGDVETKTPTEQVNGETDTKKDDSGNETGAGEHEQEEEDVTVGYDKTKSFFDNISCEAATDRTKAKRNDWRQERKLNSETFGISSTRRGGYRGRGGGGGAYYNRANMNSGGYNRGYRSNNYQNNRGRNNNNNNNNNNNRMAHNGSSSSKNQQSTSQPQPAAVAAGGK